MLEPALVIEIEPTVAPTKLAVAVGKVAPVPPPIKFTVGADVYPDPPAVTAILAILVGFKTAIPVAPAPPPPLNVNKGVVVKPVPPLTTVTEATPAGARTACAVAPDPDPEIVAVGAVVYPEPALVILTPAI